MKTRINPRLDDNLVTIMKTYCCNNEINEQDFIAQSIANELNIPLNCNYMVDEEFFIKHQISILNKQIECLEHKKEELLKKNRNNLK